MNLETLARGATIGIELLDRKLFDPATKKFGKLPDGIEPLFLISSDHPLSEHLVRVDEVGDGQRAAYRAEVDALGYRVVVETPIAVRRAEPSTFPRSAIPDHPEHVNALLAIDRAMAREQPTVADKPGRAETNFYALLPQIKKIDPELVLPFYDRLIDIYLDGGNEHYANRQAKLALGLLPKASAQRWLVDRVRALLDRRFYSTLLVDAALEATAKQSAAAALDLHVEIFERVLTGGIKPYKGLLAALIKRATAAKAKPRIDKLLLEHSSDVLLLGNPEHDELSAIFEAALAVVDALPKSERVAKLVAIADRSLGSDGDVAQRATAWTALTERHDELPELQDAVISLAFRICKNLKIGDEHSGSGVDKSFRARVGQFLQKLPPDALARRFDDWAVVLDDYEDWARAWFYDTYLTIEELVTRHPGVFKHDGIAKAVTKGLVLGAVYAENHEEFVDKLQDFLDQTAARYVVVEDFTRVAIDLITRDRAAELTPLLEKLALHARDTLQQIAIALATRGRELGLAGESILRAVATHARWLTVPTRAAIRDALAGTDPWVRFVEAAIDGGTTIAAPEVWTDLAAAQIADYRAMLHDHRELGGKRYVAVGKPDYDGELSILVDGKRTFSFDNSFGSGNTFQTARFREVDGALRVQILLGKDDREAWKLRTIDLDGKNPSDVTLGDYKRCAFIRHAPWIVALSEEQVAIFDLDGVKLAEHELSIKYAGDANDFFKTLHPLRDHIVIVGKRQTLVFGSDPVKPIVLDRKIDGSLYRDGRLLFECRTGKLAELVDEHGRVVESLGSYITGTMCGQCDEIHSSEYQPTNLRGVDGELLAQEDKKFHQLQTADNRVRGRVPVDFDSKYYVDFKILDFDGDGIDEAWSVDFIRGRLLRIIDPAARSRSSLAPMREALLAVARPNLRLAPNTAKDSVAKHLAAAVDASPARDVLKAPVFDPARAAVTSHHALLDEVYAALATTAESWPVAVVSKRIKLPSSELARLKAEHMSRALDEYPLARALESGTLDGYDKLWVRRENPTGPDMAYLRALILAHLEIARETGLHADIRTRSLDLVEQLLARSEAPDVQLFISAKEVGDGWLSLEEQETKDLVSTRSVTKPLEKELAKAEKLWGVSGFTYSVLDQRDWSIGDVAIRGTQKLGAATLDVWFHCDSGDEMVHQEEPELLGPVDAVMAALPKLAKLTKLDKANEGVPEKIWPDGAHAWKPLDEWMLAEERASIRREVAALRAAGPKDTTVGRSGNQASIARMAAHYGIAEDTAALLAAMILSRKFDRAWLASWSKIKPDALLKHFKALIEVKLIKPVEREYVLDVPIVQRAWGTSTEPAFQRLFWTGARNEREHPSSDRLRFADADVLAAFMEHVRGKPGKAAAKAEPATKAKAKPAAAKAKPAAKAKAKPAPKAKAKAKKK